MLNNIRHGIEININFLKGRLAYFVSKYKARNIFDLTNNPKIQFQNKEEEVFVNGLHHKLDAFTTVANILDTEPEKISEVRLDEGQVLTSDEKFCVAFNALARAMDNEFSKQKGESPEAKVDLWATLDGCDMNEIQNQLTGYIRAGKVDLSHYLSTYLWYQQVVEKTNHYQPTALTNSAETPVLV